MVSTRRKRYSNENNILTEKNVCDITSLGMKTTKNKFVKKSINKNSRKSGGVQKNIKRLSKSEFSTSTPIVSCLKPANSASSAFKKRLSFYLNSQKIISNETNSGSQMTDSRNFSTKNKKRTRQKSCFSPKNNNNNVEVIAIESDTAEIIPVESDTEVENKSDDDVKIVSWKRQRSQRKHTNDVEFIGTVFPYKSKRVRRTEYVEIIGETIVLNDTESIIDDKSASIKESPVQILEPVIVTEVEKPQQKQNSETVRNIIITNDTCIENKLETVQRKTISTSTHETVGDIIINDTCIENKLETVQRKKISTGTQMTPKVDKKLENDISSNTLIANEKNEKSVGVESEDFIPIRQTRSNSNKYSLTSSELKNIKENTNTIDLLPLPTRSIYARSGLRLIVIDGSNVAMGHSQGRFFSTRGLQICIDYFLRKGHCVKAFVPQFRLKRNQATLTHLLEDLGRRGLVVFTPAREVNGKMIVPYDDRYIVQCATEFDGVIVSNDNYRDLMVENVHWRRTIEKRLLMWTWVYDTIMFPPDPLGRHGPTLDRFLRFP